MLELGIIIFENTGVIRNYKDQWVNGPNVYARSIHKLFLLDELVKQRKLHGYKVVQADIKHLSNSKRSITQQINYIQKGRDWHELTDSEKDNIINLEQKHANLSALQQEQFEKRKKMSKKLSPSDRNTKKHIPNTSSSIYSDDDW